MRMSDKDFEELCDALKATIKMYEDQEKRHQAKIKKLKKFNDAYEKNLKLRNKML